MATNIRIGILMTSLWALWSLTALAQDSPTYYVNKLGLDMDLRSSGRTIADEVISGSVILPEVSTSTTDFPTVPEIQLRGGNSQASSSGADYVQIFSGFRPFVFATQSEVSMAARNRNIVMGYNNSAGLRIATNPSGPGLIFDRVLLSGFSSSQDGGATWTSGLVPAVQPGARTFGDPSVGVDRHGNFFYASLATDADGKGAVIVARSTDGGVTWQNPAVVQTDNDSDKEWLTVGPDPGDKSRDNVYVTWTSFQLSACELRFGRSVDGGVTWLAKTIFVPTGNKNPAFPQNCLTFSNPTVDSVTGRLYIPFLRFSNSNQDFIQMMISDDAGDTFRFATFNVAGAPDTTVFPVTQPGALTECGAERIGNSFVVNLRLTIHGTASSGPGLTHLPRFIQASRLTLQPAAAARDGLVYLAWNNSTSLSYGDPASHSNILFIRSDDGGDTWATPIIVNPVNSSDAQHVLPALAIDQDSNDVHISYYTQHQDTSVDLDMANSHDRGSSFPEDRALRVTSTPFGLPPTNINIGTPSNPYAAMNYDREIDACYALGEYQNVTTANGKVYVGWGDARNLIMEPTNALDPISGQTHPQQDVFLQVIKAQ